MKELPPWQNGPRELINFALEQLHKENDFSQRIAFLILDVGVETLFKTYLTIPQEASGALTKYEERRKASEGNFYNLIDGIAKAAGNKVTKEQLLNVQFYHSLRNKLYHQGNGITVPTEKSRKYANLVVTLLKNLLSVDLTEKLIEPELMRDQENKILEKKSLYQKQNRILLREVREIDNIIEMTIELIEPKLLLPSFKREIETIGRKHFLHFYIKQYIEEVEIKVIDLLNKYMVKEGNIAKYITDDLFFQYSFFDGKISKNKYDNSGSILQRLK